MRNFDLIDFLDKKGIINKKEPLWWDEDFKDPREKITFNKFEQRLKHIGNYPISDLGGPKKDIYVYETDNGKVPMLVMNLDVAYGDYLIEIPFFVTARPYTYQERDPFWKLYSDVKKNAFIRKQSGLIKETKEVTKNLGYWSTNSDIMYLPHIRGIFKEQIGKRHLYYPIKVTDFIRIENPEDPYHAFLKYFTMDTNEIHASLRDVRRDWIFVFNNLIKNPIGQRTQQALEELAEQRAIKIERINQSIESGQKVVIPFTKAIQVDNLEQVIYDEFNPNNEKNIISYYPLNVPGVANTLPIILSNKIGEWDKTKGAFAMGLYDKYDVQKNKFYFIPFTSREFALKVSDALSNELGFDFSAVVIKTKKGFCRYRDYKSKK